MEPGVRPSDPRMCGQLEQQKHLDETDQTIREVLSSRSLQIQNVYDVSTGGQFERPYERVFYTEGNSRNVLRKPPQARHKNQPTSLYTWWETDFSSYEQ
jgi:hypothetical protein